MLELLGYFFVFSVGFVIGAFWRAKMLESEPWELYRWHEGSLGYRKINPQSTLVRDDNILMSLRVDTSNIPNGGYNCL